MNLTETSTVYVVKFHKGYFKGLEYSRWIYSEDPCEALRYKRFCDAEKRGKDAKRLNKYHNLKTLLDDVSFTVETWNATVSVTMEPVTDKTPLRNAIKREMK
jgi:hypothetical protein